METAIVSGDATRPSAVSLPARFIGADGRARTDHRAIIRLAAPLVLNSAVQALLGLTDTWFVSRLSSMATAALAAVYWPLLLIVILVGGIGLGVQPLAAQAYGAGCRVRAGAYAWLGIAGALLAAPLFFALALVGRSLLGAMPLPHGVVELADAYWRPRVFGHPLGVAFWALTGFLNAVGHTRTTLTLSLLVAAANVPFNALLMFGLGWGMAGSAWGTNCALALGCVGGIAVLLSRSYRARFHTHLTWRPRRRPLRRLAGVGLPIGVAIAADLFGISVFQLMQVDLGVVAGAATQTAMALTSIAYWPAIGMGMAASTLVGQAVGAKAPDWAFHLGNTVLAYILAWMVLVSLAFVGFAHPLAALFVDPGDVNAASVLQLSATLLGLAAVYQIFDGLNLGASFALRGAGDVHVPARLATASSLLVLIPVAHTLTFDAANAWVLGLPQAGWGAVGGWIALAVYVAVLGTSLAARWLSRRWMRLAAGSG
jgi:MATE family, multidrug efflux pump